MNELKKKEGIKVNEKETKEEARASPEELKGLVDFLSEVNVLKRTPRVGWRFAGPPVEIEADYDAGHVAEVAQIAYILARMEGLEMADALKCVGLAVFHENCDTRLPEMDKVATYYMEKISQETFLRAMRDQTARLPKEISTEILNFANEVNYGDTPEAIVVKDADTLEASIQAKIFNERGFTIEEDVLKKYLDEERFETQSAKRLIRALRRRKDLSVRWWENILPEIA